MTLSLSRITLHIVFLMHTRSFRAPDADFKPSQRDKTRLKHEPPCDLFAWLRAGPLMGATFDAFVPLRHSFTVSFQCPPIMRSKSTNVSFAFSDWIQQCALCFLLSHCLAAQSPSDHHNKLTLPYPGRHTAWALTEWKTNGRALLTQWTLVFSRNPF